MYDLFLFLVSITDMYCIFNWFTYFYVQTVDGGITN